MSAGGIFMIVLFAAVIVAGIATAVKRKKGADAKPSNQDTVVGTQDPADS
ncbi:hypothetical protein LJC49_08730 [Ruminococcaceae bacterium OttesenSCG-928-I18]|nr:hypothetical protein [Ruminococcaceae bacterium OttesenSCG-928-I18]